MTFVDVDSCGEPVAVFGRHYIRVNTRYLHLLAMNNCWPVTKKLDKYTFRFLKFCEVGATTFLLPNTRRVRREFLRWVASEKWLKRI